MGIQTQVKSVRNGNACRCEQPHLLAQLDERHAHFPDPLPTQAQFSGCPDSRRGRRRSTVRHGNSLFQAASLVSLGVWRVGRRDCRLAGHGDSHAGANLAGNLRREGRSSAIRRCHRRLGVWPAVRRPDSRSSDPSHGRTTRQISAVSSYSPGFSLCTLLCWPLDCGAAFPLLSTRTQDSLAKLAQHAHVRARWL